MVSALAPVASGEPSPAPLASLLAQIARLLPAQGPISIFIHHNTLHAFEGQPFEEAVVEAARLFGCEPFLPEATYRAEFADGRITDNDLRDVLRAELGAGHDEPLAGVATRGKLAFVLTRYGVEALRGPALRWHLEELDALERFRDDLPTEARVAAAAARGLDRGEGAEVALVRELWGACLGAIERAGPAQAPAPPRPQVRHRDVVLEVSGRDIDAWIHPRLIRFVAAFLDQGLALWTMPAREQGMFRAFLACYRGFALDAPEWTRDLRALLAEESAAGRSSLDSIAASLAELGVAADERYDFLLETALALRGWGGMVCQIEARPDRVPVAQVPAKLSDLLAIRLLLERAALGCAGRQLGVEGPLAELRPRLRARLAEAAPRTPEERAYPLFEAAQLLGLDPTAVEALSSTDAADLTRALDAFDGLARRRALHLAYELHLRRRFLDALATRGPTSRAARGAPPVQAVFCLDEREESIRRHLEEVAPEFETLGTAGFFGVAMYFKGERDARARPLAPIAIRPRHYVEVEGTGGALPARVDRLRARAVHVSSRGLLRGALASSFGPVALVHLVLRVLFPRLRRALQPRPPEHPPRLSVFRSSDEPPLGEHAGFTREEMTDIVAGVLGDLGLAAGGLAPLVLLVGHASDSLNNPHRSAYDCGACGGGPGGPSARAFAVMANDAEVRAALGARGVVIPESTFFVGAEHNTTDDSVTFFDADLVPEAWRTQLRVARAAVDEARGRNAQERVRRFTTHIASPRAALRHVEARRSDLAEPRPEYNHATNAFCVVGRRARTRGLFLDRRAFLVSYDPTSDDDEASVLARTLAAVVPVVVGINLEYLFGTIDTETYGAGTKLPHNVASLVGVMNGTSSDLRTGLWAQTVEIHEPVRVSLVVECATARLEAVLARSRYLRELVENRWLFLAALDPEGEGLVELSGRPGGRAPYVPERAPVRVKGSSNQWTRGKRGHLPFAELAPPTSPTSPTTPTTPTSRSPR